MHACMIHAQCCYTDQIADYDKSKSINRLVNILNNAPNNR